MNKAKESGYVTDKDGICNSIEVKGDESTHLSDLDCMTEEDTDVVIYNLAYYELFKRVKRE